MKKKLTHRVKGLKKILQILNNEIKGFNQVDSEKLAYRTLLPCHTLEKGMALKHYEAGHGKKNGQYCTQPNGGISAGKHH